MSSNPELERILRRLKPHKRLHELRRRNRGQLTFVGDSVALPSLLLDSTVYIDQLQGKLPNVVAATLVKRDVWHSTVTESELTALAGLLDPRHAGTANAIEIMTGSIEQRSAYRIVNPDRAVWAEAGVLAGLLARLQQYGKFEHRRALNDALIFLSAAKLGLTVLTRNIADYDLLMQLAPHGRAVFYEL